MLKKREEKERNKEIYIDKATSDILKEFLDFLKEKYNLEYKDVKDIIEKAKREDILLPISIFKNDLSTLEIIVKFLKESCALNFKKISNLLNRNYASIYNTYKRALRKNIQINVSESRINIPLSIFKDKKFSALESLVKYLKEEFQLRYSEIALMLNLDQRTIWTVYKRCRNKI